MRNGKISAALALLVCTHAAHARGLDDVIGALDSMSGYNAAVTYAITLPQAEDDIVYSVLLRQPDGDSYLIDWTVATPSGEQSGFTAWYAGNFYDFRNRRLRESHGAWDPSVPATGREPQNAAQFAGLLPSRMAAQLRQLTPDRYDVTVTDRGDEIRVSAIRHTADIADAELLWRFEGTTLRPLEFSADYNPGAIAGQQVRALYSPAADTLTGPIDEEMLRRRYGEAFALYRESNFGVEALRGRQLPPFSLPLVGKEERLTRLPDAPFAQSTALVIFDPSSPLAPQLVEAVRNAVDRLPADTDVIWAAASKSPDAAAEVLGAMRPGEKAVTAAGRLAADCGAPNLPVVIACRADGTVHDVAIGLNNQLAVDVIKMFSTMR